MFVVGHIVISKLLYEFARESLFGKNLSQTVYWESLKGMEGLGTEAHEGAEKVSQYEKVLGSKSKAK